MSENHPGSNRFPRLANDPCLQTVGFPYPHLLSPHMSCRMIRVVWEEVLLNHTQVEEYLPQIQAGQLLTFSFLSDRPPYFKNCNVSPDSSDPLTTGVPSAKSAAAGGTPAVQLSEPLQIELKFNSCQLLLSICKNLLLHVYEIIVTGLKNPRCCWCC